MKAAHEGRHALDQFGGYLKQPSATRIRKTATGESGRLDAKAWTDAALTELALHGIDGVRVEPLAKRLKVTKGSFYWHFKDRDALLEDMLDHWRKRATIALIERLDSGFSSPTERLRQLLRVPMKGETATLAAEVELAIRLWGRMDDRARRALEEIDGLRLQYIASLMIQCGVAEEEARARAVLAYSYQRVAASLLPASARDVFMACENILMGGAVDPIPG